MVSVYSSIVIFSYMSTMYFSYYFSDANIWMLLKITKCNLEHHTDSNQSGQSFRNRAYINVTAAVTNLVNGKQHICYLLVFVAQKMDKVFTVLKSRCEQAVFFPETRGNPFPSLFQLLWLTFFRFKSQELHLSVPSFIGTSLSLTQFGKLLGTHD